MKNKEKRVLNSKSIPIFYKHVNAKMICVLQRCSFTHKWQDSYARRKMRRAFNTYFRSVFTAPTDIKISPQTDNVRPNVMSTTVDFSPNLVYEAIRKGSLSLVSGPDAIFRHTLE